jgi:hypothetical protein
MARRLRFFRPCRILPGLALKFSKRGISMSLGPRGLHYTIGTTKTVGVPGTGISWTKLSKREGRQ